MYAKYIIAKSISWQSLMEKIYIIDERTKCMYVLEDEVSKKIWNEIYLRNDLENVIDEMSLKYKVDKNIIEKDCMEWLDEMVKIGALERII